MIFPLDIYLYIGFFLEDKELFKILSLNKSLYRENNFRTVIIQRYPHLNSYQNGMKWKDLFMYIIQCQSILGSVGFPRFALPYDLIYLAGLVEMGHMYQLWRHGVMYSIRLNSPVLLNYCIKYPASEMDKLITSYLCLVWAVREKNIIMVKHILSNYPMSRMDIEYALPDSDQNIRELLENALENLE